MLLLMKANAVTLEGNLIAAGKIKCMGIQWPDEKRKQKKDRKKTKDNPEPSSYVKYSPEAKNEEMSQIIRNLSNKITRLEVEGQTLGIFQPATPMKPNMFRRPYSPQILPHDRRPEEQSMQPPVKRNLENILEEAYEEDTQELNQEEMHWLNDNGEDLHLTRDEYSRSINNLDYYED